ncbi:MAG: hypothetical protein MJ227_04705 [Bacilli bacterium]|nr:hypothetical protein [Bacilli bacterium]
MAKSQIIKDIANGDVNLETSLKRMLIIASDLKNAKLISWVKNELYGYENSDDLPDYRKMHGYFKITYVSGYTKISDQPIGAAILPDNLQDFAIYKCKDSISAIEDVSKSDRCPILPYADLIPYLKKQSSLINILNFYMELPTSSFKKIVDCVSRELMDILLEIDSKIGNIDELDVSASTKQVTEINNFINVKIDSFTNIGNENKISDSLIAGKDINKNGK